MSEMMVNRVLRWAALLMLTGVVAGCDKCGHPVKFNTPQIQKACYDDGGSSR